MYTTEQVNLLRSIYEWSTGDPDDLDEDKYLLAKKFSEVRAYSRDELPC